MDRMPGTSGNEYVTRGVSVIPGTIGVGEKVRLVYDGQLTKSGVKQVYAHVGFGNNWTNTSDYQMVRTGNTFETLITVPKSSTMNVCFKDSAENWDNNSGRNYVFEIR